MSVLASMGCVLRASTHFIPESMGIIPFIFAVTVYICILHIPKGLSQLLAKGLSFAFFNRIFSSVFALLC